MQPDYYSKLDYLGGWYRHVKAFNKLVFRNLDEK